MKPKYLQVSYKEDSKAKMVQFNIDLVWQRNCHLLILNLNLQHAHGELWSRLSWIWGLVPLSPAWITGSLHLPVCGCSHMWPSLGNEASCDHHEGLPLVSLTQGQQSCVSPTKEMQLQGVLAALGCTAASQPSRLDFYSYFSVFTKHRTEAEAFLWKTDPPPAGTSEPRLKSVRC